MQKSLPGGDRILHVTFPDEPAPSENDREPPSEPVASKRRKTEARYHAAALRAAATAPSYAIPVAALMTHAQCTLAALVDFADRQSGRQDGIIEYTCKDVSFEQFSIVYKILQQTYVSAEEVRASAALIDFFCLDSRRILVDLARPLAIRLGGSADGAVAAPAAATHPTAAHAAAIAAAVSAGGSSTVAASPGDVEGSSEHTVNSMEVEQLDRFAQLACKLGLTHSAIKRAQELHEDASVGVQQTRALGKAILAQHLYEEASIAVKLSSLRDGVQVQSFHIGGRHYALQCDAGVSDDEVEVEHIQLCAARVLSLKRLLHKLIILCGPQKLDFLQAILPNAMTFTETLLLIEKQATQPQAQSEEEKATVVEQEKAADALGRAGKAMPSGTSIFINGLGRGVYMHMTETPIYAGSDTLEKKHYVSIDTAEPGSRLEKIILTDTSRRNGDKCNWSVFRYEMQDTDLLASLEPRQLTKMCASAASAAFAAAESLCHELLDPDFDFINLERAEILSSGLFDLPPHELIQRPHGRYPYPNNHPKRFEHISLVPEGALRLPPIKGAPWVEGEDYWAYDEWCEHPEPYGSMDTSSSANCDWCNQSRALKTCVRKCDGCYWVMPIKETEQQVLAWKAWMSTCEERQCDCQWEGFEDGLADEHNIEDGTTPTEAFENGTTDPCYGILQVIRDRCHSAKSGLLTQSEKGSSESESAESETKSDRAHFTVSDCMDLESCGDVIVCGTEERTKVINACARELGAPYVRFRVAFVEGLLDYYSQDTAAFYNQDPAPFPMTAVWVSLGDYDNIFAYQSIYPSNRNSDPRLRDYTVFPLEKHKFSDMCADPALLEVQNSKVSLGSEPAAGRKQVRMLTRVRDSSSDVDYYDYDDTEELSDNSVCFDLKIALGLEAEVSTGGRSTWAATAAGVSSIERRTEGNIYCATKPDLVSQIMEITMCGKDPRKDYKLNMGEQSFIQRRLPGLAVVLPEAPGPGSSADDSSFNPRMTCPYFHVDSARKSCFSKEEAARASQRIVDIELVKQVQRQILTTDFVLPQVKKTVDATFCNESVYGKMNFLMVTGLVRLG
jgi:hypothetical protein